MVVSYKFDMMLLHIWKNIVDILIWGKQGHVQNVSLLENKPQNLHNSRLMIK